MPDEPKTKEDIKNMLKHLDDEYRKANISEKTYKELKEKYKQQMSYMDNTINPEEAQPEEPLQQVEEEKTKKKGGMLGGLFKKKGKGEQQETVAPPAAEAATTEPTVTIEEAPAEETPQTKSPGSDQKLAAAINNLSIDLEKLKVMLEAVRDQKKGTDESIQSLFESIGEVRSTSIQNDATSRELTSKLERIEDDVNNLRPKEIEKRFTQINETGEKLQLHVEKLQAKTDDMTERLNKVYETTRLIGNTENLANPNQNVQKKLNDIREATNYVERLSSKAEKIFIDLKMELEDLILFKSKQETLEESVRDIVKSLDAIGVKFESYTTKKEMEDEKQDIMILGKQQEDIKNVMAIVQSNVPEPILRLRKDREDIKLFLDSMEEQTKAGKINLVEYESAKKNNIEKLRLIDNQLMSEWKKFEKMLSQAPAVPEAAPVVEIVEKGEEIEEEAATEPSTGAEIPEHGQAEATQDTAAEVKGPAPQEQPSEEKKNFLDKVADKRKKEEGITGVAENTTAEEPNAAQKTTNAQEGQPTTQPETAAPAATEEKKPKKKKKIEISMPF